MMQKDHTKRLPPELLAMIFQTWKDACGAKRYGLEAEWVRATRVCKTWRHVAMDAVALWSSVLISWRIADSRSGPGRLELQLDRARGVPLDLLVSCVEMYENHLSEAFRILLSRTRSVKQLQIVYDVDHQAVVKQFIKDVGLGLVSLSLSDHAEEAETCAWEFTPDIFPRLRHLDLDSVIPTAGSRPLLTLVRLELAFAINDSDLQPQAHAALDQGSFSRAHRFLASCPNLESLRTEGCFDYPQNHSVEGKLVVALPKLRDLTLEESISDLAKILGSLRVQPSTSFHITAHSVFATAGDVTTFIIPRNVGEAFPGIRRTRRLALVVGPRSPNRLSLCGHWNDDPGPAAASGDDRRQPRPLGPPPDWSITIPDLRCFPSGKTLYLGLNGRRFLTHIPHLVTPFLLVELRLHFAHGLPVARDWPRFFATMPHLQLLELGGGTLVMNVLTAFLAADAPVGAELRDLTLCVATGRVTEEARLLSFFGDVVGSWVQKRACAGAGLRSLTVWVPAENSGPRAHIGSGSGDNRRLGGGSDGEAAGLTAKVRRELVWLEDVVEGSLSRL